MTNHKNTILIVISAILLTYAFFIGILPVILTKSFDITKFEEKFYDATSLVTTLDEVDYNIKPNFDVIIKLRNLSLKYIDNQPMFDASSIELTTTPAAIFGNTFKVKNLYLKNVKYEDQILPEGENKLAFLPGAFDSTKFGKKNIVIVPGPIKIKNLKIKYITPTTYDEKNFIDKEYSNAEVKEFLSNYSFSHIKIR